MNHSKPRSIDPIEFAKNIVKQAHSVMRGNKMHGNQQFVLINLNKTEINRVIEIPGDRIITITDGKREGIEIKLNSKTAPIIGLNQFSVIAGIPFRRLFISHTAQFEKSLVLVVETANPIQTLQDSSCMAGCPALCCIARCNRISCKCRK